MPEDADARRVDPERGAGIEHEAAVRIVAHQPDQLHREAAAEPGEVDRHVEAGAARVGGLGLDHRKLLRGRQPVDHLVDVDHDAAAADDPLVTAAAGARPR